MKWLIWNVRCINKWYKKKELRNYLKIKNIKLARFIETRVKEKIAKTISQHITPGCEVINNYNAAVNGRIWILWDPNCYDVKLIKAEAEAIHCIVSKVSNDGIYAISVVYGFNTGEKRKHLWENLKEINQMVNIPWIVEGDFNAILQFQDRKHGNPVTNAETQDFSDCIQELKLNELNWEGGILYLV
ncbi:uncharacterized protein [Nicotiana sylvestris]|uniref:uncharacterized protein n=1 Tax=Nicotiana sylvestris TaxID=4096 RepID=UPI00388CB88B